MKKEALKEAIEAVQSVSKKLETPEIKDRADKGVMILTTDPDEEAVKDFFYVDGDLEAIVNTMRIAARKSPEVAALFMKTASAIGMDKLKGLLEDNAEPTEGCDCPRCTELRQKAKPGRAPQDH